MSVNIVLISFTIFSVLGSGGNQTLDDGIGRATIYCSEKEVRHSLTDV